MIGVFYGKKPLLFGLLVTAGICLATDAGAQEAIEYECSDVETLIDDATKEELRDPKLHHRSARLYFSQGADDPALYWKAVRSSMLSVHLDPTKAEYYMQLGMGLGQVQCWERAGAAFQKAATLVAGNEKEEDLAEDIATNRRFFWQNNFTAGVEKMDEQDFGAAVEAFEAAIAVDSTEAQAYSNLGVAYHSLERYEDAIASFEAALARDPENERAREFYRLTQSFVARNTFSEGIAARGEERREKLERVMEMYRSIMTQSPPDEEIAEYEAMMGETQRGLGEVADDPAVKQEHYANAVEHYRASAEARHRAAADAGETPLTLQTDPDYLTQILNCYVASEQWDSTMTYAQELVDLDPRNYRAYQFIGTALQKTGKQGEALTYFLVAQCLRPEESEAVDDINNHFVGLLSRYQPTDDIVTASIQNLESPSEIRIAKSGNDTSEAWFFWEKGFVDCYYNGSSAGKVEFTPTTPDEAEELHGEALEP